MCAAPNRTRACDPKPRTRPANLSVETGSWFYGTVKCRFGGGSSSIQVVQTRALMKTMQILTCDAARARESWYFRLTHLRCGSQIQYSGFVVRHSAQPGASPRVRTGDTTPPSPPACACSAPGAFDVTVELTNEGERAAFIIKERR